MNGEYTYDLTIAVPTYNRCSYLARLLAKLVPACACKHVEVLVSDNASIDGTDEILALYKHNPHFRALRNKLNLGFDRNILKLLDEARGKYVWLFGDDDDLDLPMLDKVIELVKNNDQVGLFFLNYTFDLDAQKTSELMVKTVSTQLYLDDYLPRATFITLNILNMEIYRGIKLDPDCVTKEWINLQILINMVARLVVEGRTILSVENKLVFPARGNNKYSPEFFWGQFVDRFAFTVERSAKGLDLQRFKAGFYRLNIRHRFLTLGRDFSDKRRLDIYQRVTEYFRPSIMDRIIFWLFLGTFNLVGYERLKRIKDRLRGRN